MNFKKCRHKAKKALTFEYFPDGVLKEKNKE
jgi:hypothetical protein